MHPSPDFSSDTGDFSPDAFRRYGHQIVDWIGDYLEHPERYPVLSQVQPGAIRQALPAAPPSEAEPMAQILSDFERIIMPGITHWNHPSFFAYFAITSSVPGMLAEFLSAALNVNGMLWRTSPAATELEMTALDWLRQMVGLPDTFEGVIYDTASISSLVAIAAAREHLGLDIRRTGMSAVDLPRLRLYCSEQAHSSIEKDAITLGIGQENVVKIPSDTEFRMDVVALRAAIDADLQRDGYLPFCLVATVGTTSTTSIDPVPQLAAIAAQYGMWLHVDAAYGGTAAIVPEMRWVLDGAELADSIVINPHKWLFTPVDLSAFYTRHLHTVSQAFSLVPEYLRTAEGDSVRDYMNYGPQLGRRFRALKLWFILRAFGREGIVERLREHLRLAQVFAGMVAATSNWEVLAPVPFSTVCFRFAPPGLGGEELDAVNMAIEAQVNASGEAFLSHTVLHDRIALRLAIGNLRTEQLHIDRTWELLKQATH